MEVRKMVLKEVKKDDVFIDAGAQIGLMTIPVADKIKPARVIAIEPNKVSFDNLKKNVEKYKCNVELIQKAVSDHDGETTYMTNDTSGSIVEQNYALGSFITIPCVTLDTLLENETRDVVMKMDIEMAEPIAWKGMKKSLGKFRAICMEIFGEGMRRNSVNIRAFIEEIKKDGFKIETIEGNDIDVYTLETGFKYDIILRR